MIDEIFGEVEYEKVAWIRNETIETYGKYFNGYEE